jgi:anaerobic selenocysteine-containing dehydrogenase
MSKSDVWVVTNEGRSMKFSRRDLLMWGAGAAAGLMVTPVPWKILDDTSKWSQNWPWIPQPARVPIEIKESACTLCPNGCGLRVRLAAGWPVGVAGLSAHPISHGALCPLAFGAHQLNWHPQRLRTVRHRGSDSSWNEAQAAFAKARNEGPIVVIDGYPGRAASSVLKTFADKQSGSYRVVLGPESRALQPYQQWTAAPSASLRYDLENTATVLSFGAPMLDGWGMPGRFSHLWADRAAGMTDPQLRLIQVDSSCSRTASRAWQWIAIREDSDSALASGLARVLVEQNLVPAHGPIPSVSLAEAAQEAGLYTQTIEDLARALVARTPSLVIARDNNPAIAALNVLLGAVGTRGGIVRRSQSKESYVSADERIPNARAVLIDSSVPWDFTPAIDAEVFRFAAWDGGLTKADWLLPAPGFLEELTDVPAAPTSSVETYAIAPSLTKPTLQVQSAAQFLTALDSGLPPAEKIIQTRCEELFRARSGVLCGKEQTPVAQVASAQKLQEQLSNGAVWMGEPSLPQSLRVELKEWPDTVSSLRPRVWDADWSAPVLPPLATKLYIESALRQAPERRNA